MAGLTDYGAGALLKWLTTQAAMPTLTTVYLALFTAVGSDDGAGFTEVSGFNYARVALPAFAAPSGSAPSIDTTSGTATFNQATGGDWGTIIAFGLYDAPTNGHLLAWDYCGNFAWQPFTGSSASPCVLTCPAHGFSNADSVVVDAEFGGTLPATAGSWSGLLTVANATTDTFTAGVNSTGTGNGMVRKVASVSVVNGSTPTFAAGALTLAAA